MKPVKVINGFRPLPPPPTIAIRDDAAFLARLDPRIRHPYPPSPPSENARSKDELMAELAREMAAGTFRLRAPARSPAFLLPSRPRGYCLPGFPDGRTSLWVDPGIPAQHGDFVLVKFTDQALQRIAQSSFHDLKWVQTYVVGNQVSNLAIKWLVAVDGRYQLVTLDATYEINSAQVLGVVRFAAIDGRPAYGCSCNFVWRFVIWLTFRAWQLGDFFRRRAWGR